MEAVAVAKKCEADGEPEQALEALLWALDHGVDHDPAFSGVRGTNLLTRIFDLGETYPPARAELATRLRDLRKVVEGAAARRESTGTLDLDMLVGMSARVDRLRSAQRTYDVVAAHLPPGAELRRDLWMLIEQQLVRERRYSEANRDPDAARARVFSTLATFSWVRPEHEAQQPFWREMIELAIKSEGAVHFEALLGAGDHRAAEAFADELVGLRPTARTFAALIERARRAGAPEAAARLRARAFEVAPEADRAIIDEAMGEEPGRGQ